MRQSPREHNLERESRREFEALLGDRFVCRAEVPDYKVDASVEEQDADRFSVWEFATDPERFNEYVSSYDRGETTSENYTGFGASYRRQARLGPLRLRAIESIVGWDPPAEVHYDGKLMGVPFRSCLRVDDLGSDR